MVNVKMFQGLFAFGIFGFDTRYILVPVISWARKIIYGQDSLILPKWEDLVGFLNVFLFWLQEIPDHCFNLFRVTKPNKFASNSSSIILQPAWKQL